ncbi:MAG: serine/threonine-protein phosphatase [Lentisphaeria bacterium]|nr:serine/threonine-protein phosphatase [Lentisphaeria bacterium]
MSGEIMPFSLFRKKYFHAGACTDPGRVRKDNQDSYLSCGSGGLFLVSDGMGGGDGGDRASRIVVQTLSKAAQSPLKDLSKIVDLACQANQEILNYAGENDLRGMGATIVGILLSPFRPAQGLLFFAGDSPCFRFRDQSLTRLSTDHTVASAMGVPEEQLAKHLQGVLTNVAGCGPGFFLETLPLEILPQDQYLLCSDGVSRQVSEQEIKQILTGGSSAEAKACALVDAALKHGGPDNATAVVIEFDTLPEITPDVLQEEAECPDLPVFAKEDEDVTPPTA